jgi:hypothetical protein
MARKTADIEGTKQLMAALGRMPPKQHSEMKLGKPRAAAQPAKKRKTKKKVV